MPKNNSKNKLKLLKDGVYIPSIECCWLYKYNKEIENYIIDNKYLDKLLSGKIDYSFELIKDEALIDNIEIKKINGKSYTLDIVNVKYTKKYKSKDEEKTTKQLRDWSYKQGFVFNHKLMSNWKRSSGKARVGQNLFILNDIKDKCLEWARMGLKFEGKVDIGSIRAYESLPLSSIIGTIELNPKNILVIDDYESKFPWKMSKTYLENKELITKTEVIEECNSIWDGEGLLSNKIFEKNEIIKGKGVALLRNRYMKCAGFCCYIEKFFRNYCEKHNLDYETYEIEDMYNNKIKVKDILLITTPSAIKIKKYNDDKKIKESGYASKGAWLQYWKDNCGSIFGVCKTEKPSFHCIKDEDGNIKVYRNTLSYQMVNTIPFKKEELKAIVRPEIEYIERLKTDLNFFLQEVNQLREDGEEVENDISDDYIEDDVEFGDSIDVINAFVRLSKKNPKFAQTQVFKDYRRNFINACVDKLRQGKIRIEGTDYCIACGNPYEMLMATVGEFQGESLTLKDNELYCSAFKDGEDIVGFRNPSINVGNIGVQVNKFSENIHNYMNDTPNIVYLNSIKYPILSTYQGEDFDIDSNLLTNHPIIVNACKRIDKEITSIPVNCVENTGKNNRELTAENMSDVDHIISQNFIGSTINLSQELNSIMNHAQYNNLLDELQLSEIYDMTSKLSSISCCEIDKAKKQFEDLDVTKELDKIKIHMELVDNTEILKIHIYIKNLKEDLKNKRKEIQKYRSDKKKPYNKRKKEIKRKLKENKIKKLTDKEIEKLNEDLTMIEEILNCINIERQDEINIIKYNISQKYKELKKYDSRRIKPYFFKFVGDNKAKKQREMTNKKHKKHLNNKTIIQFAKDNNLELKDINKKDKRLRELLKENNQLQQEWENLMYRKLDTPMDWLQEEIDKIKNSKKTSTIQVIQLVNRNREKANEDVVDYIVKNIKNLDVKIKAYKLNNNLSSKEKLEKIKSAKKYVVDNIKFMKPTKVNLYGVMKECLSTVKKNGRIDKKSSIESISLEILFMVYGDKLLKMFKNQTKQADSILKKVPQT